MLPVTKIQHFCTKDGPGIRTTVFLKGCPLRCIWCHNLETQSMADQFFYAEHLCIRCGICEAACPSRVHHITDSGHCLERSKCTGCMKCLSYRGFRKMFQAAISGRNFPFRHERCGILQRHRRRYFFGRRTDGTCRAAYPSSAAFPQPSGQHGHRNLRIF